MFNLTFKMIKHAAHTGNSSKLLPYIISFAIGFAVPDETSAGLIQVLAALCTLQAGCMPLQVGRDS